MENGRVVSKQSNKRNKNATRVVDEWVGVAGGV
jgi:hypothetical protein